MEYFILCGFMYLAYVIVHKSRNLSDILLKTKSVDRFENFYDTTMISPYFLRVFKRQNLFF